jgi:hypothetical protein
LNIFENQQLQLFFPHCLMFYFFGGVPLVSSIKHIYIRFGSQFGFPKICWQSLI